MAFNLQKPTSKDRHYGHETRTRYLIKERSITEHGEEGSGQSDRGKDRRGHYQLSEVSFRKRSCGGNGNPQGSPFAGWIRANTHPGSGKVERSVCPFTYHAGPVCE